MRTSCSRMAFWSDSLHRSSEISVTFELQRAKRAPTHQNRGVGSYCYILGRARTTCHASGMIVTAHRRSERSGNMKTSLAIVFAAAALMVSATVGLKSTPANACYSNKSALCGAVAFPNLDQAPRPSGPGPYRGQM